MRRVWGHLLLVMLVATTAVVISAEPAAAAVQAATGSSGPFSWLRVKDSNGVSVWSYGTLPISGGGYTSPMKMIWSFVTSLVWLAYLAVVMFGVFAMYLVTSFAWLAPIADIFGSLGRSFDQVVDQFGLVPTLLTATACVGGFLIMRGRWAAGVWEIAATVLISVVGLSLLADPIGWVAGPDGVLKQANEAGLEIAADLGTDAKPSGSDLSDVQTAQSTKIVDTFVASPAQMISFGKVLSPSCKAVMAEKIKDGKDADDVRDAVGDCDKKAGEYADNPGPLSLMTLLFLMPTGVLFVVMITLLSGGVFVSSLWALWSGLKIIWNGVIALLPFGARGPLFQSIADVIAAAVIVALSSIFLGGFLLVINGVFADRSKAGWPPMASFILVDFLIVGGALVWHRQRAQLKRASSKVAQAMAWRPTGSPGGTGVAAAGAAGGGLGRAVQSAARLGHTAAMVYAGRGGGGAPAPAAAAVGTAADTAPSTPPVAAVPGPSLSSTASTPALPPGGSPDAGGSTPGPGGDPNPAGGVGPSPAPAGSPGASRVGNPSGKGALARKAVLAGQVAAAAATGGTSAVVQATAVQGAAAAARAARPPAGQLPSGPSPAGTASSSSTPPGGGTPSTPKAATSPSAASSTHRPPPSAQAQQAGPAAGGSGSAPRPKWVRVVTDGGQVVYQPVED